MRTLAALTLVCPVLAPAQGLPAPPANALILFGARWCAPCTAELHGLDAMLDRLATLPTSDAGEARPRLVLAWIDRTPPLAAHNPPQVIIAPPVTASAWAEPHFATARGLPFAAMTDDQGRTCALHRGPLQASMIEALWSACHQGQ